MDTEVKARDWGTQLASSHPGPTMEWNSVWWWFGYILSSAQGGYVLQCCLLGFRASSLPEGPVLDPTRWICTREHYIGAALNSEVAEMDKFGTR